MDTQSADRRFAPVANSRIFNRILATLRLSERRVLDLGCGFGEYLVKFGEGSIGITTTPEEVEYGKRKGISIQAGNVELIDKLSLPREFDAVWANNLFEHLLSPHAFLIKLKTVAKPDSVLILGVPIIPRIASLMRLRKFRGALAIAHVNFFTRESLRLTVECAGWRVDAVRPFLFSNLYLDNLAGFLMPHVYVVARNDADFRYGDKKLKEWKNDPHYKEILDITGQ